MNSFLNTKPVRAVQSFYSRYKKYYPLLSFTGGFLWDSFTLTRIDRLSDNLILLLYLLLLSGFILLLNLVENGMIRQPLLLKYREWYPLAIQFFLGGLFSSYVVFYFQSAALTKNWLFLLILVLLLVSNEFLEKRLTNLYLQMTLFFLASFSFFIFFVPVVSGYMNYFVFLLSGLIGLLSVAGMLFLLFKKFGILQRTQVGRSLVLICGIFLLINLFYFLNWIPPVPLSMKSAGIYHHVSREGEIYRLKYETPEWYQFRKKSDNPYHYSPGDTVFCFTAVFAPTRLQKKIFHRWQWYDSKREKWQTSDRLGYQISGGRKGGYRGYTYKTHVTPGKWRVEIVTEDERILGRIGFEIKETVRTNRTFKTIYR